jgi:hypothetical protein
MRAVTNFLAFLFGLILMVAIANTVNAQECTPGRQDGPIAVKHSAVKKPGDGVLVCYTLPVYDEACDPLEADTAITEVELYVNINEPVNDALGPIVVDTDFTDTCFSVTADSDKGSVIYYATRAKNAFGTSALSNQEFVKLPGSPKPGNQTVN